MKKLGPYTPPAGAQPGATDAGALLDDRAVLFGDGAGLQPVEDVTGLDVFANEGGQSGLTPGLGDSLAQRLAHAVVGIIEMGHAGTPAEEKAKAFATVRANRFARKGDKMLCMKTMGEIVREWRTARGIKSRGSLAQLVATTRQNIDNLENDRVSEPTAPYLRRLAKLMGYASVEDLLELRDPPLERHHVGPIGGRNEHVLNVTPYEHRLLHEGQLTVEEAQSLSYLRPRIAEKVLALREIKRMSDEGELPETFEVVLEDDAMGPDFPASTTIKFRRGADARFGNRVLLRDGKGDLHFREYTQSLNADGWIGKATGRGFADIRPGEHGAQVVAVKTGHYVEGA